MENLQHCWRGDVRMNHVIRTFTIETGEVI